MTGKADGVNQKQIAVCRCSLNLHGKVQEAIADKDAHHTELQYASRQAAIALACRSAI